jgi:hypothetical protein
MVESHFLYLTHTGPYFFIFFVLCLIIVIYPEYI